MAKSNTDEVKKLEKHLALLREEYVKIQNRLIEYERKYETLAASVGAADVNLSDKSFVNRLLKKVSDLFEKDLYSDITIHLEGHQLRAHRFVLSARSNDWGVSDLASVDHLEFYDIPYNIGVCLLKWVYTDHLDAKLGDGFIVDLMKAAKRFNLDSLMERCESLLISRLDARNCIKFYQIADQLNVENLKEKCSLLITSRWDEFTGEDFNAMSAPLLYKMLKTKGSFPLHSAIKLRREDVTFLFLIEFDAQIAIKINEKDDDGKVPLILALDSEQESLAKTLISHKSDVNVDDSNGKPLLISSVEKGNNFASKFLIENGADVNCIDPKNLRTCLHILSDMNVADAVSMSDVAELLIKKKIDLNKVDSDGNCCLHLSIRNKNEFLFNLFINSFGIDLNKKNLEGRPPIWYALLRNDENLITAQKLFEKGANLNVLDPETGNTMLHWCIDANLEDAAGFLLRNGVSSQVLNKKGESALHLACRQGMTELVKNLLTNGANPNVRTETGHRPDLQAPLHLAIAGQHRGVIKILLNHKGFGDGLVNTDVNLADSEGETPLGLALWSGFLDFANDLIDAGADPNSTNVEKLSLLHRAIYKQDEKSSLFLIEKKVSIEQKTPDGSTPLILAVKMQMSNVVRSLCKSKCNTSAIDGQGDCALWSALTAGQEDIASILVENGCDVNFWSPGPNGCMQTILHRSIDENNETAACFLIRSMCDVNAMRKLGPNGEGSEEVKEKQTPLHMAASWGLAKTLDALIEHGANVNAQDVDGRTPVHVAVMNQHTEILNVLLKSRDVNLLLRDRKGLTPFATAMQMKSNKAAEIIQIRDPRTTSQVDNKGYNFLHTAVKNSDLEAVLFLLSTHMDVKIATQDSERATPLHLAVQTGDEMIVRNLLLAGANINDKTNTKQTALHLAATNDKSKICSILLEYQIDFDALDNNLNNALHVAVQRSSLSCVKVLLTESRINAEAVNIKGQTPLHLLGLHGKENAAAIFEVFMETMPDYPVDKTDADGNTVLLNAYMNGNFQLCKATVKAGACLGTINSHGISVFNYQTPTKQVLFRLLDQLVKEPKWADGEFCSECGSKFSITVRKHHCRHCGRLLCAKCSEKNMPIIKYDLQKPVRVCNICFDVLTLGAQL